MNKVDLLNKDIEDMGGLDNAYIEHSAKMENTSVKNYVVSYLISTQDVSKYVAEKWYYKYY